MKEIKAFAIVRNGEVFNVTENAESAKKVAETLNGTVVELTGKMPRELRKISTEVWIEPCDAKSDSDFIFERLGYNILKLEKNSKCTTRARITLEELPEENES